MFRLQALFAKKEFKEPKNDNSQPQAIELGDEESALRRTRATYERLELEVAIMRLQNEQIRLQDKNRALRARQAEHGGRILST